MSMPTQPAITPPAPGQEREEPELWYEDDIPVDHRERAWASGERSPERDKPHE
jgi:hypothetical protein